LSGAWPIRSGLPEVHAPGMAVGAEELDEGHGQDGKIAGPP